MLLMPYYFLRRQVRIKKTICLGFKKWDCNKGGYEMKKLSQTLLMKNITQFTNRNDKGFHEFMKALYVTLKNLIFKDSCNYLLRLNPDQLF